jgi:DNA-binding CsgD family transcriptional regulator
MGKQKVVIVHCSAIIQKGLAELLMHTCNVSVSQSISDYSDLTHAFRLKKAILFIDLELLNTDKTQLTVFKNNGNSVFVISDHNATTIPEIPEENVLFVNDSLNVIQKKLNSVFPSMPKSNIEPTELTFRETEVLKLVAMGNSNKETADQLSISLHTVISHRKNICRKLEIKTISGLTLYALINNLIS